MRPAIYDPPVQDDLVTDFVFTLGGSLVYSGIRAGGTILTERIFAAQIGSAAESNILRQTGSGSIIGSADEAYSAIRASTTDVGNIANSTGYKLSNIQKVKDHLFYNEQLLDRYVSQGFPATRARFDSDIGISQAWRRLETGTHGPADLQLLRHETAEAWYMRNVSEGYNAAHNAAQKRFPAPGF